MLTDCNFNTTDSQDAKQIFDIIDEMHFDIHSRVKSMRDRKVIKNYFIKRSIPAS